jgi:predicted SAM-dependent methyltransferase
MTRRFLHRLKRLLRKPFRAVSPQMEESYLTLLAELSTARVHRAGAKKARALGPEGKSKLNIGCGTFLKPGFLNVDYRPEADLRLDLRQPLPFPNGVFELVFSEHFLEHLKYPEEASRFVGDCQRILRPGGVISISVPGTEWPLQEYAAGQSGYLDACNAHQWHPPECTTFMEHINYHFRQRWSGKTDTDFDNHRFAYDFETMKKLLENGGFADVEERPYDPALDSEHRRIGSLFVTARKPSREAGSASPGLATALGPGR